MLRLERPCKVQQIQILAHEFKVLRVCWEEWCGRECSTDVCACLLARVRVLPCIDVL